MDEVTERVTALESQEASMVQNTENILDTLEVIEEEILELIEIEAYAASHTRKPKARIYAFRVGKTRIEVMDPIITGRHILELAGKIPPEKYTLRQVLHGGHLKPIELTDEVDLRAPGVERFRAMPRTANDG
jgi:hypothetical protein